MTPTRDEWDMWFSRMQTKYGTVLDAIAPDHHATWQVQHTGGGCLAYELPIPGGFVLVTDDNGGIGSDPDNACWIVGRYEHDNYDSVPDDGYLENLTLNEAIIHAERLLNDFPR